MYTEKGSFGISISHLWTDYWIDFVAWPMISFCSDEPGVTAHICIRSYKTGRSLPHIYIYIISIGYMICNIVLLQFQIHGFCVLLKARIAPQIWALNRARQVLNGNLCSDSCKYTVVKLDGSTPKRWISKGP